LIDLALPPYNCVGNTDPDTGIGMDCTQPLLDAIGAAMADNTRGGLVDLGGSTGNMIRLPKGTVKVSPAHTIVLPYGVGLEGCNDYASALWLKPGTLAAADHFIDIGDRTTHLAAFGGKLRNMTVFCPPDEAADSGTYAVYSNNNQDTAYTLDGLRIYGGQRGGLKLESGYGGASIVRVKQVTCHTFKAGSWCAYFNFGDGTMVEIDGMEPATRRKSLDPNSPDFNKPMAGGQGMFIGNGRYDIKRVHYEQCETCTQINQTIVGSVVEIYMHTRGELCGSQITVQNGSMLPGSGSSIGLMHVEGYPDQPGSHTVLDGRSGRPHIDGHIKERIVI